VVGEVVAEGAGDESTAGSSVPTAGCVQSLACDCDACTAMQWICAPAVISEAGIRTGGNQLARVLVRISVMLKDMTSTYRCHNCQVQSIHIHKEVEAGVVLMSSGMMLLTAPHMVLVCTVGVTWAR